MSEKKKVLKEVENAIDFIKSHSTVELESSARTKPWPQTWKCQCGQELTAANFGAMQYSFLVHLTLKALEQQP
jgi:hypothetical protein